jgi:hypothetical protein
MLTLAAQRVQDFMEFARRLVSLASLLATGTAEDVDRDIRGGLDDRMGH